MRLSIRVGDFTVQSSEADFRDCMAELQFLTDAPRVCPVCGSPLTLNYRNPKSKADGKRYRYFGLICQNRNADDCHEKTFGQFEDGSGLFYKWNDEDAPWVRVGDVRGGRGLPHDEEEAQGRGGDRRQDQRQQPPPRDERSDPREADYAKERGNDRRPPQGAQRPASRHSPMHGAHSQYQPR